MNEPMDKSWVTPLNDEDREYFAYFRTVCKRYNIDPSRANRLEYEFLTRVAESEFYLQKAATVFFLHTICEARPLAAPRFFIL